LPPKIAAPDVVGRACRERPGLRGGDCDARLDHDQPLLSDERPAESLRRGVVCSGLILPLRFDEAAQNIAAAIEVSQHAAGHAAEQAIGPLEDGGCRGEIADEAVEHQQCSVDVGRCVGAQGFQFLRAPGGDGPDIADRVVERAERQGGVEHVGKRVPAREGGPVGHGSLRIVRGGRAQSAHQRADIRSA